MGTIIGALAWLWTAALTVVYFLVVITMIATIHEFGHYIICKLLGVRVDEFSIGFGRLLFGRKWGETEYNLRAWPIAAYVRPAGMDPSEEEVEGYVDPGERSFNKKNSLVKYAILLGGSVFNIISTMIFLAALFMYVGEGDTSVLVKDVAANGPAFNAGVRPDDLFVSMDGVKIKDADLAIRSIKKRPGEAIPITVRRTDPETKKETLVELVLTPESDDGQGRIGISYTPKVDETTFRQMHLYPALQKAREKTWEYVQISYSTALKMFTRSFAKREVPKDVGGPVSIVGAVGSKVKAGMTIQGLLELLAMLSLAIGVFNLLPVPALDGGRILVLFLRDSIDLAYMLVFWKEPDESLFTHKMEELLHFVGICLLLLLLLLVTYKDIKELIFGREQAKLPTYSASPSPAASPSASPSAAPLKLPEIPKTDPTPEALIPPTMHPTPEARPTPSTAPSPKPALPGPTEPVTPKLPGTTDPVTPVSSPGR